MNALQRICPTPYYKNDPRHISANDSVNESVDPWEAVCAGCGVALRGQYRHNPRQVGWLTAELVIVEEEL